MALVGPVIEPELCQRPDFYRQAIVFAHGRGIFDRVSSNWNRVSDFACLFQKLRIKEIRSLKWMGCFWPIVGHSQMSGNPVRIGGGCATVTGYKLPMPLVEHREGGSEVQSPKSGYRFACARHGPALRDRLLRQEKDEASLPRECGAGFVECLHSPFCRSLRVFCFWAGNSPCPCKVLNSALVSQSQPFRVTRGNIERSANEKRLSRTDLRRCVSRSPKQSRAICGRGHLLQSRRRFRSRLHQRQRRPRGAGFGHFGHAVFSAVFNQPTRFHRGRRRNHPATRRADLE